MNFILVVLIWLVAGICLASVLLLVANRWLENSGDTGSLHDKVRHQIRRVLLY